MTMIRVRILVGPVALTSTVYANEGDVVDLTENDASFFLRAGYAEQVASDTPLSIDPNAPPNPTTEAMIGAAKANQAVVLPAEPEPTEKPSKAK